jgi:hypothetical protein
MTTVAKMEDGRIVEIPLIMQAIEQLKKDTNYVPA